MKFFVIFLFVVLAVVSAKVTQEKKDKLKKAREDCQADPATKVDAEAIERLKNEQGTDDDKVKAGAFNLCVNVKMGVQKPNGDIDIDQLKKEMKEDVEDDDNVNLIVNHCGKRADGNTPGEAATALAKCLLQHVGLLPK